MKNNKFVHGITCPYCLSMTLKLIPKDSTFDEYYESDAFCTECGRSYVKFKIPENEVA